MQLRLIGSLSFLTLFSITLVAQTSVPNAQKPSATPTTVHQMFVEDQEDLQGGANGRPHFAEEEYNQRLKAREMMLRAMLAEGEIRTGDDFSDAAVIFQHGNYNETFLSDSVRTDFCVPGLSQQKENVAMFNAGKWPRETMHPPCH